MRGKVNWCLMLQLGEDTNLMIDATKKYIDYYGSSERGPYISFSCHSKSIHPGLLDFLKKYHLRMENIYGRQLKAITYQQAACNLNLG